MESLEWTPRSWQAGQGGSLERRTCLEKEIPREVVICLVVGVRHKLRIRAAQPFLLNAAFG